MLKIFAMQVSGHFSLIYKFYLYTINKNRFAIPSYFVELVFVCFVFYVLDKDPDPVIKEIFNENTESKKSKSPKKLCSF